MSHIFHACLHTAWEAAKAEGCYRGSADDERDGFIHFSDGTQIVESTKTHHGGQEGLVLLVVAIARLGEASGALRWESSRSGRLFPHLYAPLPIEAVIGVHALPLDGDGHHRFPPLPAD